MNEETTLWKGSPSQWLNLKHFAAGIALAAGIVAGGLFFPLALAALVLPLGYLVWRFLEVRTRSFELTNERLRICWGVINRHHDEIELYRVKDILVSRPWWMRVTGLASVILDTSDRSLPRLVIPAIVDGREMREILRKQVELIRDKKRVRELDFDDAGGSIDFGG